MDREIIPNRLREVREEQNEQIRDIKSRRPLKKNEVMKNLEYIAKTYGGDKAKYSKYETGKSPIPAWVLLAYADEFNVSVDYLLKRSEAAKIENYSAGHELGLADEAIETLKYIKKNSDLYSNALAVINAFLSQDSRNCFFESLKDGCDSHKASKGKHGLNKTSKDKRDSYEAFTLFSSIFNAFLSEYVEEQQGIPNTGMHESDIMRYIKQYIDETIRPALRKELAKAYKTPRDY